MRALFYFLCVMICGLVLLGCARTDSEMIVTDNPTHEFVIAMLSETPTEFVFTQTILPSETPLPIHTDLPTVASTVEASITPIPSESPQKNWIWHEAEEPVEAPILLYHHITPEDVENEYYLSLALFEQHMDWIISQGYTTITTSTLVEALTNGASLPEKPILITFDDGYDDLYEYAYPVMQERNMVATVYLIGVCLDAEGCIRTEQVLALADAGWEFGIHSMTHQDLTTVPDLNYEMYQPRVFLEQKLDIPMTTFAYPYGAGNDFIYRKSWQYGYSAAMGLGKHINHHTWTLFYLSRLVMANGMTTNDLEAIILEAKLNDGL